MDKWDCCVQGQGHSKSSELLNLLLYMVMHHYELECLPKILVCCLQGQGHSEGYIIKV